MPWNSGIQGTHLSIAADPGTPLRVVAGPGTGKTFALMRRVARLLEQGAQPNRILAVTAAGRTPPRCSWSLQKPSRQLSSA